jgi:hypothetical protein
VRLRALETTFDESCKSVELRMKALESDWEPSDVDAYSSTVQALVDDIAIAKNGPSSRRPLRGIEPFAQCRWAK